MRVGLVRKIGYTAIALSVVALGGCDDDPLDFDPVDAVRMSLNPSSMVIRTGDTVQFVANAINDGGEPTFGAVTATVGSCGGTGSISVSESPQQTAIQPPQIFDVAAGAGLGAACIVVQGGGVTDTADVVVVGGELVVLTEPSPIRAGETTTMVVQLLGVDGTPVTPFAPTDVTWTTGDALIATVDDSGVILGVGPEVLGNTDITATWTGTAGTGTSGLGVSLSVSATVFVTVGPPVSAAFAAADFGAIAAGATSTLEVIVTDLNGTVNLDPAEVLGATAVSDAPGIATVVVMFGSIFVEAPGVSGGTANISGTVQTSASGDLPFGPIPVFVLDPQITAITPNNGLATGETNVVITGTGLSQAGVATTVTLDGEPISLITVDSDTQITIDVMRALSGGPGPGDVVVSVGGVLSPPATWTQNDSHPEDTTEPANDNPGAASVLLPLQFSGTLGPGDTDDIFEFTLAADATIQFDLSWVPADGDLDLLQDDVALGQSFPCGFPTATTDIPESGTCTLPAGTYQLWVNDFGQDGVLRTYDVRGVVVP